MLELKLNGQELPVYPIHFKVTVIDLYDGETTERTLDGILNLDWIAEKRKIELGFNAMRWRDISTIQSSMYDVEFDFTYPDPKTGYYETKTFYVNDRPAHIAIVKDGEMWWEGFQMTLTEV